MYKNIQFLISLSTLISVAFSMEIDTSYSVKWQTTPGNGGIYPAGPPWSMVGPYDFDEDGYDFVQLAHTQVSFVMMPCTMRPLGMIQLI